MDGRADIQSYGRIELPAQADVPSGYRRTPAGFRRRQRSSGCHPRTPAGVKVIVIDSVPSNADVIEAIEQKAFSYFSRPFDPAAVRDMMQRAVTELGWDDGIRVLSAEPEFLTLKVRCNIPTAERLQHFFEELKND